MWWDIVLVALALFLALVLLLRSALGIRVKIEVQNLSAAMILQVDYLVLHWSHQWTLPIRIKREKQSRRRHLPVRAVRRALWLVPQFQRVTERLWERMTVREFVLDARIGMGDAAQTALWTGRLTEAAAWWIDVRVVPRASQPPSFAIEPVWDRSEVLCNFSSIIQLRVSDIILAVVSSLRTSKGGRRDGKSVRAQGIGASD